MHTHACTCTCIVTHVHTGSCTTHMHVCTCIHVLMHTQERMHTTHTRAYTHRDTHMHTGDMHVHSHTREHTKTWEPPVLPAGSQAVRPLPHTAAALVSSPLPSAWEGVPSRDRVGETTGPAHQPGDCWSWSCHVPSWRVRSLPAWIPVILISPPHWLLGSR